MELLVVMTIIAILMGILLPVGHQVNKQTRKTMALKTGTELRSAMTNYYSEYKRFPSQDALNSTSSSGNGDISVTTDGSSGLIAGLISVPENDVARTLNPRRILFFTTRKAKTPASGGIWVDDDEVRLNDPWGEAYHVLWDANYDNVIEVPSRKGEGSEDLYATVAVWSTGPDKAEGKGEGSTKNDDIHAY